MNKIKSFSRLLVALVAANVGTLSAEYHVVQPGDVLSLIAEKKRVQSGFLLSTEQIMLTLYKLNKDVFVNDDINQLTISGKILIPDNTSDYIQLSKAEAQQKLRDKSYLKSLRNSEAGVGSAITAQVVAPISKRDAPNYAQVKQVLDSHQQMIEGLKVENQLLTNKFNLLERALGRVVLVQGLLTNDMVQLRSKFSGKSVIGSDKLNGIESLEAKESNMPDLDMPPALVDENKTDLDVVLPSKLADTVKNVGASEIGKSKIIANEVKVLTAPIVAKSLQNNTSAVIEQPDKEAEKKHSSANKASLITNQNANADNWYYKPEVLAGISFAVLSSGWLISFLRRRRESQYEGLADFEADIPIVSTKNEPSFDLDQFNANTDLGDDVITPVKTIIENSQKLARDSEPNHELGGVLELLDMCLLCGDYEQAHAVTIKALAEHKTSAILKKKLAFIERKKAKL